MTVQHPAPVSCRCPAERGEACPLTLEECTDRILNPPDPRDDEIARLTAELREQAMNYLALDQQADTALSEVARLRAAMAEMQDDLDAAHRLLGLAPYPLTA